MVVVVVVAVVVVAVVVVVGVEMVNKSELEGESEPVLAVVDRIYRDREGVSGCARADVGAGSQCLPS